MPVGAHAYIVRPPKTPEVVAHFAGVRSPPPPPPSVDPLDDWPLDPLPLALEPPPLLLVGPFGPPALDRPLLAPLDPLAAAPAESPPAKHPTPSALARSAQPTITFFTAGRRSTGHAARNRFFSRHPRRACRSRPALPPRHARRFARTEPLDRRHDAL
jgi:hypothetical protein